MRIDLVREASIGKSVVCSLRATATRDIFHCTAICCICHKWMSLALAYVNSPLGRTSADSASCLCFHFSGITRLLFRPPAKLDPTGRRNGRGCRGELLGRESVSAYSLQQLSTFQLILSHLPWGEKEKRGSGVLLPLACRYTSDYE